MIASKLKRRGDSYPVSLPPRAIKTCATAEARSKNGRSYKPLPVEFTRDGFSYRQIARDSDAAIYEQTWNGRSDASACYEVIRIRRRDGFQIDGRFVEPAEVYPNSDAWGADGWTVPDKESAFNKLREIINSPKNESPNPVKKSLIQNTERCSKDWGKLAISTSDHDRAMDAAREYSKRAKQRLKANQKGLDSSRIGQRRHVKGATLTPTKGKTKPTNRNPSVSHPLNSSPRGRRMVRRTEF